jgi:hypothetical protein
LSASETAAQVIRRRRELLLCRRRVRLDADREVVEIDRLPHRFGLPFLAGVNTAHRALQLRELAHHVGGQIRLAKEARFARGLRGLRMLERPLAIHDASLEMRSAFSR